MRAAAQTLSFSSKGSSHDIWGFSQRWDGQQASLTATTDTEESESKGSAPLHPSQGTFIPGAAAQAARATYEAAVANREIVTAESAAGARERLDAAQSRASAARIKVAAEREAREAASAQELVLTRKQEVVIDHEAAAEKGPASTATPAGNGSPAAKVEADSACSSEISEHGKATQGDAPSVDREDVALASEEKVASEPIEPLPSQPSPPSRRQVLVNKWKERRLASSKYDFSGVKSNLRGNESTGPGTGGNGTVSASASATQSSSSSVDDSGTTATLDESPHLSPDALKPAETLSETSLARSAASGRSMAAMPRMKMKQQHVLSAHYREVHSQMASLIQHHVRRNIRRKSIARSSYRFKPKVARSKLNASARIIQTVWRRRKLQEFRRRFEVGERCFKVMKGEPVKSSPVETASIPAMVATTPLLLEKSKLVREATTELLREVVQAPSDALSSPPLTPLCTSASLGFSKHGMLSAAPSGGGMDEGVAGGSMAAEGCLPETSTTPAKDDHISGRHLSSERTWSWRIWFGLFLALLAVVMLPLPLQTETVDLTKVRMTLSAELRSLHSRSRSKQFSRLARAGTGRM